MAIKSDALIVGLTGSFGSGCTTLSEVLSKDYGFASISLSAKVREVARDGGVDENDRDELQNIGNELRQKNDNAYLARVALKKANSAFAKSKEDDQQKYVFTGFRHSAEVQEFRKYNNFFLITIDCSKENRWERLKDEVYNGDRKSFDRQDKRDEDEGLYYGQQVIRCVEQADIIFINEHDYPNPACIREEIKERVRRYVNLLTRERIDEPNPSETMMTVASSLALQSPCIKRRVGAVLCDKRDMIISAAYNKVPGKGKSCLNEYMMCYRDFSRDQDKEKSLKEYKYCPLCKKYLKNTDLQPPDFDCPSCGESLAELFPPYKALDKCRALHAEEAVVLNVDSLRAVKSTLYTTTFPCLQCAKRIVNTGLQHVIYIDPYPRDEQEVTKVLEGGGVETEKFEGVKAQVYYKLYHSRRERLEREAEKRRMNK